MFVTAQCVSVLALAAAILALLAAAAYAAARGFRRDERVALLLAVLSYLSGQSICLFQNGLSDQPKTCQVSECRSANAVTLSCLLTTSSSTFQSRQTEAMYSGLLLLTHPTTICVLLWVRVLRDAQLLKFNTKIGGATPWPCLSALPVWEEGGVNQRLYGGEHLMKMAFEIMVLPPPPAFTGFFLFQARSS